MITRKNKILGGLLGGAIGDSMGAPTEFLTRAQIKEMFGGNVTSYVELPDHMFVKGTVKGMVTDDFSLGHYTALAMLKRGGKMSDEAAIEGLINWNNHPIYSQCAGPTTRLKIAQLRGETVEIKKSARLCMNQKVTDGAGMKSGIVGIFNPGNVDGAIEDAITMCKITHETTLALSSACAISAAVAKAFEDGVSYLEVIEAGIYGADKGFNRAVELGLNPVAGCSISKKIALAAEIGLRYQDDFEEAMKHIADIIGAGLYAYESIPAVFGFIAACKGRALDTIYMGVNCGDDTDTVACMAGYIVGALNGADVFPKEHLNLINEVNGYDLEKMAGDIDALV